MIQLATDPKAARRTTWGPAEGEAKESPMAAANRRSGHAWPFISRHGERPAQNDSKRAPRTDNGS